MRSSLIAACRGNLFISGRRPVRDGAGVSCKAVCGSIPFVKTLALPYSPSPLDLARCLYCPTGICRNTAALAVPLQRGLNLRAEPPDWYALYKVHEIIRRAIEQRRSTKSIVHQE